MPPKYRDLPIGMRFRPSDSEMAGYFLRKKALGHDINARTVPEECHDIFSRHPRDLPDYGREEHWYFFCNKNNNEVTTKRSYNLWIPTGEITDVFDLKKKGDQLVGIKSSFAFIENEEDEESDNIFLSDEEELPKYNWFMDEISLPLTVIDTDWVLCHIFFMKSKPEFVNLHVMESESESESDQSEKDETVLPPPPDSP